MVKAAAEFPAAVEFGNRVRRLRADAQLSQMDLAQKAGLHFTYLSSVERRERNISLRNILRLAAALRVDPADLVRALQPGS